jgi:hypothetical protein
VQRLSTENTVSLLTVKTYLRALINATGLLFTELGGVINLTFDGKASHSINTLFV